MLKTFRRNTFTAFIKRRGGASLMMAMFACALVALTGFSLAKLQGATFSGLNSSEATMQAQHHAKTKMGYLIYKGYNNLASQAKTAITGSNFKDSVSLGMVITDSDGLSRRLVTVSVYKGDEIYPRATLEQVFYSNDANLFVRNENSPADNLSFSYSGNKLHLKVNGEEKKIADGVPIGTIIAWPGNSAPTEGGTWLLCNGGTFNGTTYSVLENVLGGTTLPNLSGRFLEGTTSAPRSYKNAGLPNITGKFSADEMGAYHNQGARGEGAFYLTEEYWYSGTQKRADYSPVFGFDASRSSNIYGASDTVQPASYTVRYYIKAA